MLPCAMPRVPDEPLQGAAFLYRSVDEAHSNARIGGTCFLVSRYAPKASNALKQNSYIPFWVSNRHVVYEASAPVVRVNRRDSGTTIFDYDCLDWTVHPDGDDLAAVCAFGHVDLARDEIRGVPEEYFVTRDKVDGFKIGVGDDIAMIGRFINHQGRNQNRPSIRFGNISMMPEPIQNNVIRKDQLSYAVEMRSRTGFSGSPVAVYRMPGTSLMPLPDEAQFFHGLLGVCWGHIIDEEGENTWLNGVIPAWKITDLLDTPKLKDAFEAADAVFDASPPSGAVPSVAVPAAEPPTKGGNPQHREDFNRLLGAAVGDHKKD